MTVGYFALGASLGDAEMRERRRTPRPKCLLRGRIYFNKGRSSIDCLIRDISYEGARVVFSDPVNIPDAVELYIPKHNRTVHALVRWRHADQIGLAFSRRPNP